MQARMKITAPHGHASGTKVLVDGLPVPRLAGVDVSLALGQAQDIKIVAQVRICGTVLPGAVEHALLVYLQAKYPKPEGEPQMVEITTPACIALEYVTS